METLHAGDTVHGQRVNAEKQNTKVDLDLCRLSRQIRSAADEGRPEGADLGKADAAPAHQGQVSPDSPDVYHRASCFPSLPSSPALLLGDIYIYIYICQRSFKASPPCNHAQLSSPGGFDVSGMHPAL